MDLAALVRPTSLHEVVGQQHVCKSLEGLSASEAMPHAMLFHGPSGTGKTTVARVAANMLGITAGNLIEVDAASASGAADMRAVADMCAYRAMGGTGRRMVIVDECHSLSKQAWQVLLKPIEDAAEYQYFVFCTTEPDKVPKTAKTRCHEYPFKPVGDDDLLGLLDEICAANDLLTNASEKDVGAVFDLIVERSEGSPRQALTYLSQVAHAKDYDDAAQMIESAEAASAEAVALCRHLFKTAGTDATRGFRDALRIVSRLQGTSAESVRLVMCSYFSTVALKDANVTAVDILSVFSGKAYNQSEKWAPLIVDLAEFYLGGARDNN